jgi:hypothetical protein
MHRAIASWLIEHPWRGAVAIALCAALSQIMLPFTVLACAIPVLSALRFNTRVALAVAGVGAAVAGWISYSAVAPPMPGTLVGIAVLFFSPVLLAVLLKRTGSMNLCFQVAVLGAGAVLMLVHLALADPVAVWTPILNQLMDSMAAAGLKIQGDKQAIILVWARSMWGALTAIAHALVLGSLLLGRWWDSLLQAPGAFGGEYRRLRLGLTLGVTITALFVLALTVDSPLVGSLAWVAFMALVFQGLAAAHRSKAGGSLHRAWLAAIYVLLVLPLSMGLTVVALAIWGFADNWLRPRQPASL